MKENLDQQKVKEKAVELAFAARMVIQQLVAKDRTAEGFEAQEILERSLTEAISHAVGRNERAQAA